MTRENRDETMTGRQDGNPRGENLVASRSEQVANTRVPLDVGLGWRDERGEGGGIGELP